MDLGMQISKLILAFMVLINPFGALSIFLDLTRNNSRTDDRPQAETKPLVDANVGSNKRINATAWAAMKSKLGL